MLSGLKPRPNDHNIVWCSMLRVFGHPFATCYDLLSVVGTNLKMVKFFMRHLWMLHGAVVVWPGSCLGMHTSSIFNSQHVTTRYNRVTKREHVAQATILRSVECECWLKAPAKRSHFATYRSIIGCNMCLATLLRGVGTCWVLLAQI